MQQVKLGERMKPLGIQRLSVAEGSKCRALLIDPNPQAKYIAYDDARKCRVEVTQEMCMKYNLRPSTTYFYMVAKLNTDLNGQVIGDKFTVEYLQLSENLNNEFADAVAENPQFTSLLLTKVKKTGENGKDFSYIKTVPSNLDLSDNAPLMDKITAMRGNQEFINATWSLIDAATSLTPEQYEERRKQPLPERSDKADSGQRQLQAAQQATQQASRQVEAPQAPRQVAAPQPAMPQVPDNDFGGGSEDFDF